MTNDNETLEQQEVEQYIKRKEENDYINPTTDLGHSYSYIKNDKSKFKANFDLIEPKLNHLIASYKDIIEEDLALKSSINKLQNSFTHLQQNNISEELKASFNEVFLLIKRIAEEEQRIEQESPLSKNDSEEKSTRFFELKAELMQIKDDCFTVY